MSTRNREKRAAKKRRRMHGRPTPTPTPRPGFADGTNDPDDYPRVPMSVLAADVLLDAARDHLGKDSILSATYAEELARTDPHSVAIGAAIALARALDEVWRQGWTPADLTEIAARRTDDSTTALLADAIAAKTAEHAPGTVDDRWAAQVRQSSSGVWWSSDRPHLLQWAARAEMTLQQALLSTINALAMLVRLPPVPQIMPIPGTAHGSASGSRVDQKILARVRGLLAKAESTEYPQEAEALSAKAQELMNRYAFERALLDADEHRQQSAAAIRIWLERPYVDAKAHLIGTIARANRCRSVFYPGLEFIALVGAPLDLQLAELLTTSLLVQATRAMIAAGQQRTGGSSRIRSFRRSFLISYAVRIGERLQEADARAHDSGDDMRLLPVLADRSRVVEETFRTMFGPLVERSVPVSNRAGWTAGRAAADRADLDIGSEAIGA